MSGAWMRRPGTLEPPGGAHLPQRLVERIYAGRGLQEAAPQTKGQGLSMGSRRRAGLSDLHIVVLSWIKFHPGHTPEDIAKGLRATKDVDEVAKLCADLAAVGFIEPVTRH